MTGLTMPRPALQDAMPQRTLREKGRPVFIAKIIITLRKSILDPQGKAVLHGAHLLGSSEVDDIRIGKFIEMKIDVQSEKEAQEIAENLCLKLLANPVMEDYNYTLESVA